MSVFRRGNRTVVYHFSNGRKFYDSGSSGGFYTVSLNALTQETIDVSRYPAILNEDFSRLVLE